MNGLDVTLGISKLRRQIALFSAIVSKSLIPFQILVEMKEKIAYATA